MQQKAKCENRNSKEKYLSPSSQSNAVFPTDYAWTDGWFPFPCSPSGSWGKANFREVKIFHLKKMNHMHK
ncbi:mCG147799 [Mus musculus]|jgi:hypothetical protein|nr:mCG147799 [Mus musculus]